MGGLHHGAAYRVTGASCGHVWQGIEIDRRAAHRARKDRLRLGAPLITFTLLRGCCPLERTYERVRHI